MCVLNDLNCFGVSTISGMWTFCILHSVSRTVVHACYLSLCNAIDDGLQCFMRVTFEDTLHTAGSGGNGLPHRHVQVVVVFLGGEILNDVKRKDKSIFFDQKLQKETHPYNYLRSTSVLRYLEIYTVCILWSPVTKLQWCRMCKVNVQWHQTWSTAPSLCL